MVGAQGKINTRCKLASAPVPLVVPFARTHSQRSSVVRRPVRIAHRPPEVDLELSRFCERFKAQLLCGANTFPGRAALVPLAPGPAPSLAPTWLASLDERQDKLAHLQVHTTRVVTKDDDDWYLARACKASEGLSHVIARARALPTSVHSHTTKGTCGKPAAAES